MASTFTLNENWFRDWSAESSSALFTIVENMKASINPFVPVKTGNLRDSAITQVEIGSVTSVLSLEYTASYAEEVNERTQFVEQGFNAQDVLNQFKTQLGGI